MIAVIPGTIQVWSDIGCPWAHAAVWRLWDARASLGLEDQVRFDHRVFPLELFNSQATPLNELEPEMPVCATLAPRAGWRTWSAPAWTYPATTRDGYVLPGGDVLLAVSKSKEFPGGRAVEVTREGKVVWSYAGTQSEVNTVQKLGDGRYQRGYGDKCGRHRGVGR